MQILTPAEAKFRREEIRERILNGEIFIYPTDTIYGIGCNALDAKAVQKIRDVKKRGDNPFSIIAPDKEWIKENCVLSKEADSWISKLPGPYTLIMKTKGKAVAEDVAPGKDSLGIRIPEHWISNFVKWLGFPIITTSVNISDEPFMTDIEELDDEIKIKLNFAIYEGVKEGRPSKLVHLEGEEVKIRER